MQGHRGGLGVFLITGLLIGGVLSSAGRAASDEAASSDGETSPQVAGLAFVDDWTRENLENLVELYRELHAHPELSLQETKTAARVAEAFEQAGYRVTSGVGGTGVVGVLKNGPGPTLMIRGDMDALPVSEESGLEYASEVTALLPDGRTTGVMHACGHDVHTTNLVASARLLAEARDLWSGTLVMVAQPAEEIGQGARDMMAAGLFEDFPRPDYTLALHVDSDLAAGTLGFTPGFAFANVDSVDVTFYGRGGHGARPHSAIDPIVTAASFVSSVQTLVSRRLNPQDPGVVTVGSIHAGTKHNVIPNEARLQLTVRSYSDETRGQLLEGIAQIAADTCRVFQCPRPPGVTVREEYTPALYNDPAFTARAVALFGEVFGAEQVFEMTPTMGGEDFGRYARALDVPGLMFRVGAQDPERFAASRAPGAVPLPGVHSSGFAPAAEPTLDTAIRAMGLLALDVLTSGAKPGDAQSP
ncbi:MAG: amidohydrolase [Myxococcota bacterium]|jgi:amidohydrolase|nr:amidohydrolase [Myxococcota bacterium]